MMKYVDDTDPHFTAATANGWLFSNPDSVANFYKETSLNKVTITGTVFDWATPVRQGSEDASPQERGAT